jgi:hypothetical protein
MKWMTSRSHVAVQWTFTLHFSSQHPLTDQPPGMWNLIKPGFLVYIFGMFLKYSSSSFWLNRIFHVYAKHSAILSFIWGSSHYHICMMQTYDIYSRHIPVISTWSVNNALFALVSAHMPRMCLWHAWSDVCWLFHCFFDCLKDKFQFHIWPTYSAPNQSYVRYNPL